MLIKSVTFFITAVAVIFLLNCSGSQYEDNPGDNIPENNPVATPLEPVLLDNGEFGYSANYNASIVVESIDSYEWDSSFDYVSDWILGVGMPNSDVTASNTTNIFLDPYIGRVYIHLSTFNFSVLGYDWMNWFLTNTITANWERLEIDGTSTWGMVDCPEDSEAASENIFHFEGKYDVSDNVYKGQYTWTQESAVEGCVLSCSGAMTVVLEQEFYEIALKHRTDLNRAE